MFVRIINSLSLGQWVKETLTFTRSLLSEGLDRFIFSSSRYYACSCVLFHSHDRATTRVCSSSAKADTSHDVI